VADLLADRARRPRLWLDWGLRRDGGPHNGIVEALATLRGREMADLLERRFGYVRGRDLWVEEDADAGHDELAADPGQAGPVVGGDEELRVAKRSAFPARSARRSSRRRAPWDPRRPQAVTVSGSTVATAAASRS
jgi:hypothetical protein